MTQKHTNEWIEKRIQEFDNKFCHIKGVHFIEKEQKDWIRTELLQAQQEAVDSYKKRLLEKYPLRKNICFCHGGGFGEPSFYVCCVECKGTGCIESDGFNDCLAKVKSLIEDKNI